MIRQILWSHAGSSAPKEGAISTPDSPVKLLVVPTNEELLIARDIMIQLEPLRPGDSLDIALRRHLEEDMEELPVAAAEETDPPAPGSRTVGLISRRDIISAYHRQMQKRR